MPEGDSVHRAARALRALVGEELVVETPHPRAAVERVAERLDGRRLLAVEAVGKNVVLRFQGGLVLRNHLRMSGRWRVQPAGERIAGKPWLVLRGARTEAVLWNGSVLELHERAVRDLGPDILAHAADFDTMLVRLRSDDGRRAIGEALLDQRVVSGIGNMWKAEALWHARASPWRPLTTLADADLVRVLEHARRLMLGSLERGRQARAVYRRAGRPCRRCGTPIRSRGQGDDNRTAYWCPSCQPAHDAGESRASA